MNNKLPRLCWRKRVRTLQNHLVRGSTFGPEVVPNNRSLKGENFPSELRIFVSVDQKVDQDQVGAALRTVLKVGSERWF